MGSELSPQSTSTKISMERTCSMNLLSREKVSNQFTSSKCSLHLEELQLGHHHQPPQEEDSLPLKNQVWAKTGQLVEPSTRLVKFSRLTHNGVVITMRCTSIHQTTSGPIHTMILMTKCSTSETEPTCLQTETLERWLSPRSHTPTDKPGPTHKMELQTKEVAQSPLSEECLLPNESHGSE